jgi:hypothetical protein
MPEDFWLYVAVGAIALGPIMLGVRYMQTLKKQKKEDQNTATPGWPMDEPGSEATAPPADTDALPEGSVRTSDMKLGDVVHCATRTGNHYIFRLDHIDGGVRTFNVRAVWTKGSTPSARTVFGLSSVNKERSYAQAFVPGCSLHFYYGDEADPTEVKVATTSPVTMLQLQIAA